MSGVLLTCDGRSSPTTSDAPRRARQLELVATIVISAATVLTAWSGFQSAKWSGVQAAHIEARFRDEFAVAFEEWLAADPLANPAAAPTPFALVSYRLAATDRANELDVRASMEFEEATRPTSARTTTC